MIVGISLPLYSVRFGIYSDKDFGILDGLAVVLCLAGIAIAMISDNQLREYVLENQRRRSAGEEVVPILDTGLWKYSRHPNYFGEQLWWWSLAIFSVICGQYWAIAGTAFNSFILFLVTDMTEDKMLREWSPERADLFKKYRKRTARCLLWPPKRVKEVDEDFQMK